MNNDIEIECFEERPDRFWVLTGPIFASASVRREMPYLRDDSGYVWFIALAGSGLVGMASMHVDKKQRGHLHGLYVAPERRGNGIADLLIAARMDYLRSKSVASALTTANKSSAPLLVKHGFTPKSTKGNYAVMEATL